MPQGMLITEQPLTDHAITIPVAFHDGRLVHKQVSVNDLLHRVLYPHIDQLVNNPDIRKKTRMAADEFLANLLNYAQRMGWDDATFGNMLIAINYAAAGEFDTDGEWIPYSTLVRTHNPLQSNAGNMFTIGRGRTPDVRLRTTVDLEDPNIPLQDLGWRMAVSDYWTRTECGEIAIPVDDFCDLLPKNLLHDEQVEIAFLKVMFSDGAWQLYCQCLERDVPIWESV